MLLRQIVLAFEMEIVTNHRCYQLFCDVKYMGTFHQFGQMWGKPAAELTTNRSILIIILSYLALVLRFIDQHEQKKMFIDFRENEHKNGSIINIH